MEPQITLLLSKWSESEILPSLYLALTLQGKGRRGVGRRNEGGGQPQSNGARQWCCHTAAAKHEGEEMVKGKEAWMVVVRTKQDYRRNHGCGLERVAIVLREKKFGVDFTGGKAKALKKPKSDKKEYNEKRISRLMQFGLKISKKFKGEGTSEKEVRAWLKNAMW
ncbi:translation machinery-associated protein 7 [Sesbania bispinosa]|nr:translation machinery-associated protein 7 [Sesbania bispinosa]